MGPPPAYSTEAVNHALQVLEFGLVTERLASHSETPLGAELCAQLAPTYQPDEVWRRLGATEEAHRLLAEDPPPSLAPLHDPRDLFNRAGKGGALEGIEVYRCAAALGVMRQLKTYFRTKGPIGIAAYADSFPDQTRLEERLLAALRARKGAAAHKVVERVQAYLSGKSREWLSDPIYTVRDGRYVLPVKAE